MFFSLLPGATLDNHDWVRRKRNVVLRFQHSSLYWRLNSEKAEVQFNTCYCVPEADFAASGGGVPLFAVNAGLVGVAAVSRLPDVEDHRLVVTTPAEMIGARVDPMTQPSQD